MIDVRVKCDDLEIHLSCSNTTELGMLLRAVERWLGIPKVEMKEVGVEE